jgi:hypothetical protein
MSDTYSVELTFKQWMLVTSSLGHAEGYYRGKGLKGRANKLDATADEIASELSSQ